uniref:lytic murein transglycosylase n=1 Tax=Klebsiella pneumoniae TaxID=573 RepID=UPI001573EB12
NVQNGVVFWNQYQDALNRAYQVYGVPPEIIVGIIGVETRWGRGMGKTRILDALATPSFSYPRRAENFSSELETFLLMARSESDDP